MNKKIGYIFGLLVLGLFIISACELANQNAVGRKIVKNEGVQQRVVDGGAGENIGGANLDYEIFEAPEDEVQAVELLRPEEPFPGVAWVTGLECGGIINEELIEEKTLEKIDFINIGGGLPSEYANTNVKVIGSIITKIQEFKSFLQKNNIKLIIEPGRFISAPAIKLKTQIIGVDNNNITVNASVYNSDMDALVVPVKLLVEGEGQGKPYVIKGITPCSMDLFRYKVYLDNPKIGDTITFLNAGAYNFTTNFCDLDEIETEIK